MAVDRERLARIIGEDLRRAKSYYEETLEPQLLERRQVYQASREYYKSKYPKLSGRSDFRSFDFYAWVQWAKAQALGALFGVNKVVDVVGQGPEDEQAATVMGELLTWQIVQQCKGFLVYDQWIQEALIYELGIVKCWWDRVVGAEERTERMPLQTAQAMQMGGIQIISLGEPDLWGDVDVTYRRKVITDNRPRLDHLSPFDLRYSPEARSLDTANFVAQRRVVTASELWDGADKGLYDKAAVTRAVEQAGRIQWSESDLALNPELDRENAGGDEDEGRRLVELYECYVKVDAEGKGRLEDMIVTIAGDEDNILSVQRNTLGRLPFFTLSIHRDPYKVMPGVSMSDIEGEVQHLRTVITRQLLVNISENNEPRAAIDAEKVNIQDLIENRRLIRVKGSARISDVYMPLPVEPIAPWTMTMLEQLKASEEEWTGKTRYNQGMDASSLNKTATGITAIMEASAQRINGIIKTFAETGVHDLMRYLVELNQKWLDQSQVIRVLNKPMVISPDDLSGQLDIVVNADVGLTEKAQQQTALTSYLREVYPFAMQLGVAGPPDFARAAIKLLELTGLKNADQYLRSPEEIQQMMMQQQAMQQAASSGTQAGLMAALTGGDPSGGQGAPAPAGL